MMVRLSYSLKEMFSEWLHREIPEKAEKILNQIRSVRGGELTSSEFGKRMTGEGPIADTINQLFETSCKRYRLNETSLSLSTDQFVRSDRQIALF